MTTERTSVFALRILFLLAVLVGASFSKADTVSFEDVGGVGLAILPGYYITLPGCGVLPGGDCETYPFSLVSDNIPGTLFIGDPAGYVSDEIVTQVVPFSDGFTAVGFKFTAGLDISGPLSTCASVGGCGLIYNGSEQTIGELVWGPGLFQPPSDYGDSTILEFQHVSVPEPNSASQLGLALLAWTGAFACRAWTRRRRGRARRGADAKSASC